jgi:hypothetical protein
MSLGGVQHAWRVGLLSMARLTRSGCFCAAAWCVVSNSIVLIALGNTLRPLVLPRLNQR